MKNIFEREHDQFYESIYLPLIKRKFNESNLFFITKRKILSFFHLGDDKNFLAYRFEVLRKWIKNNERYTKSYINQLEYIIKKLSLSNELNSFEKQYIIDMNSIVFAKQRNLKELIVNFNTLPKEIVFYHYQIDSLGELKNDETILIFRNCDFCISTQRIIFFKGKKFITFLYEQIKNYVFRKDKIIFNLKGRKSYCIKCENTYVLYVSLERVLKREKIVFNN